jgi:hypothetical protein
MESCSEDHGFLMVFFQFNMDWIRGKFTGKPHDLHGKIDGFRLRFSPTNQSIDQCFKMLSTIPGSRRSTEPIRSFRSFSATRPRVNSATSRTFEEAAMDGGAIVQCHDIFDKY